MKTIEEALLVTDGAMCPVGITEHRLIKLHLN